MNKEKILQITSLVDLTTLSDLDNPASIQNIVNIANTGIGACKPASVCVYSNYSNHLSELNPQIKKAIVAGYFPSGQASIQLKQKELTHLNLMEVDEIDFVVNKGELIANNYEHLHNELEMARSTVPDKCLKIILETGVLSNEQIAKASQIAIGCNVDFLKTSTGKIAVGATEKAAEIFANQIKQLKATTGIKVSGGIRTIQDAEKYISLVQHILGESFIQPETMRIGASSLFTNLAEAYQQHD